MKEHILLQRYRKIMRNEIFLETLKEFPYCLYFKGFANIWQLEIII
jgi:hypothetical protein